MGKRARDNTASRQLYRTPESVDRAVLSSIWKSSRKHQKIGLGAQEAFADQNRKATNVGFCCRRNQVAYGRSSTVQKCVQKDGVEIRFQLLVDHSYYHVMHCKSTNTTTEITSVGECSLPVTCDQTIFLVAAPSLYSVEETISVARQL